MSQMFQIHGRLRKMILSLDRVLEAAAHAAAERIGDTRDRLRRLLNDGRRGLRARGFAVIGKRWPWT